MQQPTTNNHTLERLTQGSERSGEIFTTRRTKPAITATLLGLEALPVDLPQRRVMPSDQPREQSSRVPHPKFVKSAPESKNLVIRPPGDFLWVDYQDDKSQGRELSRSKQAFVRTRHHRMRREKQLQQLKAPSGHCPPASDPAAAPSSKPSRRRQPKKEPQGDEGELIRVQEPPVFVTSLEAGVLDGAPALSIAINQNPNLYFQHYRIHSSRSCFPLCSSGVVVWFWQKALEDPALMQIKLSISASHRAAILEACGAPAEAVMKPAQDALRLRVGTIKSVQEILQNKTRVYSESTVFLIAHLIVSEGVEGNVEAVEAHMNGMEKIIVATGGMDQLEFGTLAMVYSCVFLRSMIKNAPPALPMCKKYQERVFKESVFFKANNRFTKLAKIGTRFFTSSWSRDLPPSFRSIISLFQQLVAYYESLDISVAEPMSVENDCLLYLSYRLLWLPEQCTLTPFQETLRLSIVVYASVRIWTFYGMPCLEALVERLQESLYKSLPVLRSTASDLLFWILFIGSLASKRMKCHSWFLAQLMDSADQLLLEGWESAIAVLEKFFFVCRPKDEPARELWHAAFRAVNIIV
ncbi:hypothetical protein N7532_005853 [Penicillium argentinense]|uniref:Uncharacterized protein n=1 Tax=Penicillium argentinense TaxID=1131581 RepID=A0A9W9KBD9_9EURO|nr:uncharacterized protein N7532_005853 [Penicillium argentinense]KAJ5098852.1 hypothetical protein N7532_005853 [Penicillium argentinense]